MGDLVKDAEGEREAENKGRDSCNLSNSKPLSWSSRECEGM